MRMTPHDVCISTVPAAPLARPDDGGASYVRRSPPASAARRGCSHPPRSTAAAAPSPRRLRGLRALLGARRGRRWPPRWPPCRRSTPRRRPSQPSRRRSRPRRARRRVGRGGRRGGAAAVVALVEPSSSPPPQAARAMATGSSRARAAMRNGERKGSLGDGTGVARAAAGAPPGAGRTLASGPGMGPRVVITGIGMVTPVGLDTASTWARSWPARAASRRSRCSTPSRISCGIAAEVKGFDGEAVVGKREARKMDRCGLMAVQAAREAWAASGAEVDDPTRVGVIVGSCVGGFAMLEAGARRARGARARPHLAAPHRGDARRHARRATSRPISAFAAPNFAVVSACATGAHSIGEAAEMVRRGDADLVLAGGVEACITELIVGGFCNMRALGSPRDGRAAATASRPFDATRDGFVIGEGAAVVVLEREDDARARGAPIVAELVGYGASNDAFHIAHPHPEGIGVVEMMRAALARTDVGPGEIGYINPHGTSTPLNDSAETAAIRGVFGAHADRLAVSSTKSMTGHLFGGAGALETVVCALAVRDRIVPPTINLRERDPACDLDYVTEGARRLPELALRALELHGPRRPQRLHPARPCLASAATCCWSWPWCSASRRRSSRWAWPSASCGRSAADRPADRADGLLRRLHHAALAPRGPAARQPNGLAPLHRGGARRVSDPTLERDGTAFLDARPAAGRRRPGRPRADRDRRGAAARRATSARRCRSPRCRRRPSRCRRSTRPRRRAPAPPPPRAPSSSSERCSCRTSG